MTTSIPATEPQMIWLFLGSAAALFGLALFGSATLSARARSSPLPREERWYRLYIWISLRSFGVWLGFLVVCMLFHSTDLLSEAVGFEPGSERFIIVAALILVAAVVNIGCAAFEAPRYRDVRSLAVEPSEVIRIEILKDICITAAALLFAALEFLTEVSPKSFLIVYLAAVVAIFASAVAVRRTIGIRPFALSHGEVRDAVFRLALRGKVTVRNLYVLPVNRWQLVNAFAVRGGNVMLSQALVESLSKREVDALIAHELTHVGEKHITKIAMWTLLTVLPPAAAMPFIAADPLWALVLALVMYILVGPVIRRRYEWRADRGAAALTEDPEAVISGLVKITTLNCLPLKFARPWSCIITHPSTYDRVQAVATEFGVPKDRFDALIAGQSHSPEAQYAIGSAESITARLFTTEYKMRTALLSTALSIAVFATLPLATSRFLPDLGPFTDLPSYFSAALATALATSIGIVILDWLLVNRTIGMRNRKLAADVRGKFSDEVPSSAVFVGLSPSHALRIYENRYEWDVGFVWFDSGSLFYRGELAEFAIAAGAVTSIERQPARLWLPPAGRIVLTIRTPGGDRVAAIRPLGHLTTLGGRRSSERLHERILEWRAGVACGSESVRAVSLPASSDVTSQSPRALARAAFSASVIVASVALVIDTTASTAYIPIAFTIPLAGLLHACMRWWPLQRYKDPPAPKTAEAAATVATG